MMAGAERLGQAIFGRREKAANDVPALPEMWRYWHDTKVLVESRGSGPENAPHAAPGGRDRKRQGA